MLLLSVIDSSFLTFIFNEMSSRQKQSNSLVSKEEEEERERHWVDKKLC